MPDKRQHRGPHPHDGELFDRRHWPALQSATADLCWLLGKGYSQTASVKLVGDRHSLRQRQRLAVQRSACSDQSLANRVSKQKRWEDISGEALTIDGFNLLMTIEAALSKAVILVGRDGCYRDMASVHGTFRLVQETLPALTLIGDCLEKADPSGVHWLLDSPVSNSGRLATQIRELAEERNWNWQVQLVTDPDAVLRKSTTIVISADSVVLDDCSHWCNIARQVISDSIENVNLVPMVQ